MSRRELSWPAAFIWGLPAIPALAAIAMAWPSSGHPTEPVPIVFAGGQQAELVGPKITNIDRSSRAWWDRADQRLAGGWSVVTPTPNSAGWGNTSTFSWSDTAQAGDDSASDAGPVRSMFAIYFSSGVDAAYEYGSVVTYDVHTGDSDMDDGIIVWAADGQQWGIATHATSADDPHTGPALPVQVRPATLQDFVERGLVVPTIEAWDSGLRAPIMLPIGAGYLVTVVGLHWISSLLVRLAPKGHKRKVERECGRVLEIADRAGRLAFSVVVAKDILALALA